MNIKRFIAGMLSLCLIGGIAPLTNADMTITSISANAADEEEEYTTGTYGDLEYKRYSDHVEITGWGRKTSNINIPSEIKGLPVTIIGEKAFWDYDYMSGDLNSVILPDSIEEIQEFAFSNTDIRSIKIPNNVKFIGRAAFQNCNNLLSVVIPGKVKKVGSYAFNSCYNLKSVIISQGVEVLEDCAFHNCQNLSSIIFEESNCKIYDIVFPPSAGSSFDFAGTIYGNENSTAQEFAEKNGFNFEPLPKTNLGDINDDGAVDALDASLALMEYAALATGKVSVISHAQRALADVNKDDALDAFDASDILRYYAYTATGGTDNIEVYLNVYLNV